MSSRQPDGSLGGHTPPPLESLQITVTDSHGHQLPTPSEPELDPSLTRQDAADGLLAPPPVGFNTKGPVASCLDPWRPTKSTATGSRPKTRHHTTVVTFPVGLENASRSRHSAQPSVSWEDYDSDGEGFSLRRNRRNKSYRAAVTSLNMDTIPKNQEVATLKPVRQSRSPSPGKSRNTGRKYNLGRRRHERHGGSFKDAPPRLYQEIRERGLHSTNQDELLDDFVVVDLPASDDGIVVKNYKPVQLTWSQLPQVKERGILDRISTMERKRQEAIFEIITSEYSYLHSLGILVRHFKNNDMLRKTMTATEYHHLFSNISVILGISKRFFEDLEQRHLDNPVIRDISDIVQNHAAHHFEPYIVYCSNETYQQRTLQKLLSSNSPFKEALRQIEGSSECGGLPMISFLILPMQRVTRLPLLLDTICQKTQDKTAEYFSAMWALYAMSRLVDSCNDGARRMERTEQMYTIQKQMDFGKIKPFPLVSSSRWLRKRGELAVSPEELSIWRAFSHRSYHLFLFNDVLIITKKKSEESFVVLDYATMENVEVQTQEDQEGQMSSPTKGSPHLCVRLLLRSNSEGRAEMITLLAENRVDRARWVSALREHRETDKPCREGLPQYEATKAYMPREPDELGLKQAELVIVLAKEEDWCHGERMRDGESGWFPASCATEITSPTAMQHNVQRMKRLRKETDV